MARAIVLSVSIFVWTHTAYANDCGWIGDVLGLCDAAEVIGKDAAEEVGKSVVAASENAYSAINFWAKLIQDYHTGSEEQQENARTLVRKVFGTDNLDATEPFLATFEFSGFDTKQHPLRVAALSLARPDPTQKIKEARSVDFNFKSLRGRYPVEQVNHADYEKDIAKLRKHVGNQVGNFINALNSGGMPQLSKSFNNSRLQADCSNVNSVEGWYTHFGKHPMNCQSKAIPAGSPRDIVSQVKTMWRHNRGARDDLTSAIMSILDDKVHLKGARKRFSIPYQGQRHIALVIPSTDIANHRTLSANFTIHVKGQPDKTLPIYENNDWEISWASLDRAAEYESIRPDHGHTYKAYLMDIDL